ncbi:MAG: beta-ketoacyl-ACP synthase II [Actinobacteria bacterium]|nr:beta-ketoacyl-ACP synthase II [Actinomycetota bacterium]
MSAHTRVVVTGLGLVTPLGTDVASTWQAVLAGKSGVRALHEDWAVDLSSKVAGAIDADLSSVLDKVAARRMDRSTQFAVVAAKQAVADANVLANVDPIRLGVVFGTGIGGLSTVMQQMQILNERGPDRVNPLTVPMIMPNAAAALIELEIGAQAGAHAPVSACATSAEAIAWGTQMIRDNRADVVVVGGTEAVINRLAMAAFSAMRAMSTRNDDPATASRPYDLGRDGFVMSEGAGALVLERLTHATARGANIYAEIAGFGMTSDAHHIAAPDPAGAGAARAMLTAVADAGATTTDVLHLNAHATSTPLGDIAEAAAVRKAFGSHTDQIAVTAPKSSIGHTLGGAGAIESILTIMSIINKQIPRTINISDFDPKVNLDVVINEHRAISHSEILALNNSFGFGGHNVCVAIRNY